MGLANVADVLTNVRVTPEQKIKTAVEDDLELLEFWEELTKRDDLQLLFKQVRELPPKEIKKITSFLCNKY